MRRYLALALAATVAVAAAGSAALKRPISLHPENPRYFLFRGKPTVLITSAEHYGAVLNLDFDYRPYLDELKARRFNLTRIFTGAYVEPPGAFNIKNNTLAPAPGRFIAPWARSETPGYAAGGSKFFRRLREFVREAGKRGVVVEVVLFCPYYEDMQWKIAPLNAVNNVQGIGAVPRTDVLTLKHPELLRVQEAMVRKVVAELREYDNVLYELCNEPYFGGVTLEWQQRVSEWIVDAEGGEKAANRHLIAQNWANGSKRVENPNPRVSLFNFHYSSPPDSVALNWHLNRAIGFDETGFKGVDDLPYRTEGWDFILAGGALYNHLDYSFTTATPDGSGKVEKPTPGGGGPALRGQLQVLGDFVRKLPVLRMRPENGMLRGELPKGVTARVLAEPGKLYALYVKGGSGVLPLKLALPAGRYRAEWIDTKSGAVARRSDLVSEGGEVTLESPEYREDVALRLTRK